uniref:Uncharacterized protein n=1 Tax=Leersia perrieri TaxID=77586 RepID=A0A0D9VAC6_9ORYZ
MGDRHKKWRVSLLDKQYEGASTSKQARHSQSLEADFRQSIYGFHMECSELPNRCLMFMPDSAHHPPACSFSYGTHVIVIFLAGFPNTNPVVASEARGKRFHV